MEKEINYILKKFNQEHILEYLPLLSEEEQNNLEEQIKNIDFEQLTSLYEESKKQAVIEETIIEHISYVDKK